MAAVQALKAPPTETERADHVRALFEQMPAVLAGNALGVHDAWPVATEAFFAWAVEDRFVAGRPDWTAGGARISAPAPRNCRASCR